jgi:hypothetical protein
MRIIARSLPGKRTTNDEASRRRNRDVHIKSTEVVRIPGSCGVDYFATTCKG